MFYHFTKLSYSSFIIILMKTANGKVMNYEKRKPKNGTAAKS